MTKCAVCGIREGTHRWGDTLAMTHGTWEMWCEVCVVTKQLEHAENRAALIPELRARMTALTQAALPLPESCPPRVVARHREAGSDG